MVRKALIIGQFAISIILIAGTIIVYRQVSFMRSQRLGADIDQTLVLKGQTGGAYNGLLTQHSERKFWEQVG